MESNMWISMLLALRIVEIVITEVASCSFIVLTMISLIFQAYESGDHLRLLTCSVLCD